MKDFTSFFDEQKSEKYQFKIKDKVYTIDNDYKTVLKVKSLVSDRKRVNTKATENNDEILEGLKLLLGEGALAEIMSQKPSFEMIVEMFNHCIKVATNQLNNDGNEKGKPEAVKG